MCSRHAVIIKNDCTTLWQSNRTTRERDCQLALRLVLANKRIEAQKLTKLFIRGHLLMAFDYTAYKTIR